MHSLRTVLPVPFVRMYKKKCNLVMNIRLGLPGIARTMQSNFVLLALFHHHRVCLYIDYRSYFYAHYVSFKNYNFSFSLFFFFPYHFINKLLCNKNVINFKYHRTNTPNLNQKFYLFIKIRNYYFYQPNDNDYSHIGRHWNSWGKQSRDFV